VKFITPITRCPRRKHYQFTAVDDCTRLRVLRIYTRLNQRTAIQFADYVLEKLPSAAKPPTNGYAKDQVPGVTRQTSVAHVSRHPSPMTRDITRCPRQDSNLWPTA
jgi:hypothetical protein